MTGRDWAAEAGIPKRADGGIDWAAEAGISRPAAWSGMNTGGMNPREQSDALKRAQEKQAKGEPLTPQETAVLTQQASLLRGMSNVAIALQPFFALSDVVKGVAGEVQGTGGSAARGVKAAAGHLTYGGAEYLPGMTGARAQGVSGAELLKGTKYEGDAAAILAVELLSDPSILLLGVGGVAKAGATAGRLASLEKLAKTPEGAAKIRGALQAANTRGDTLLRLSDEITGVPAVARGVARSPVGRAAQGAAAKFFDRQLPNFPGANAVRNQGGGTIGDAVLTPDQKRSIYGNDPTRVAREEFRTDIITGESNLRVNIGTQAADNAKVLDNMVKGLNKADAAEVSRLFGRITSTTKPAEAAEVFRKLRVISDRIGRSLEAPFLAAVKAADNTSQAVLGPALAARNLPAVINPEVSAAIQAAQTGDDLVPLIGQYGLETARPRGILGAAYTGRSNPAQVIEELKAAPEIPAVATVDANRLEGVLEATPITDPLPAAPIEPVGIAAAVDAPRNAPSVAERITQTPPATAAKSPAQVMEDLFSGKVTPEAAPTTTPQNVLNDLLAGKVEPTPAPAPRAVSEADYEPWAQGQLDRIGTITPDETAAVTLYAQDGNFGQINRFLRGSTDETLMDGTSPQRVIDQIDSLMARSELPEPITVYRGIPMGRTTIGLRTAAAKGELVPGTVFPQQAYSSATVSEKIASRQFAGGGAVFEIELPAGAKALPLGKMGIPDEAEVLIGRGQNLVIREATDRGGTLYIKAGLEDAPVPVGATKPGPLADLVDQALSNPVTLKTPKSVLDDLLAPKNTEAETFLPTASIVRTAQPDLKAAAGFPETAAAPRMVEKTIQTKYRTVEIDANSLDWGALPDNSARTAVLNAMGAKGASLLPDATGTLRLNRSDVTAPLSHPVIQRYFSDDELMTAQRQGTTLGEKIVKGRAVVPEWYNPRDPAPFDAQRAMHEQAQADAVDAAFPNDFRWVNDQHEIMGDDTWLLGDAFSSWDRVVKPNTWNTRAASNAYADRVAKIMGRPPTKGEVFAYRMALGRYRQAVNARNLNPEKVADHLREFYKVNPEATLYEGVMSAVKEFNAGKEGKLYLQTILRRADSGFERQMSTLEKKEFAQRMIRKDEVQKGRGGGGLFARLQRNPEEVSEEFKQVFAEDIRGLTRFEEVVRTRTASIVRAETLGKYRGFLEDGGGIITQKELAVIQRTPVSRLTPDQLELRKRAADAIQNPGSKSGWVVMDRNVEGYFERGDVIPWWAYHDLFVAKSLEDAAVSSTVLSRVYDRAFSAMNARLLSSLTSVLNDQVGQMLQMGMWGVGPDAVIEGIIRRATANPEEIRLMRESGLSGASLEHNIGADLNQLHDLAKRVDGDTDMTRLERIIDPVLRFAERSSGVNPTAMTGKMGVVADVAGLGSHYVFKLRSKMSDLQRESLYFHRRQLGDTPKQAAQFANDVLLDMRLVPAYAKVVRRVWPFFNWIAMSGPRSIITVLRKPQLAAAYQKLSMVSDQSDPQAEQRRLLMPPTAPFGGAGWINLGGIEGTPLGNILPPTSPTGSRLYLDPKSWDPTNTIPQLMDYSGTKLGAVDLPWFVNLWLTVQGGTDRFGRNIYDEVLNGGSGGYVAAAAIDRPKAQKIAVRQMVQQFAPSYAPGSTRAKNFVRSIVAAAELPQDGSKDLAIAHFLTSTEQGRAFLSFMQHGAFMLADDAVLGTRESPYTDAPPTVRQAAASFLLPLRSINPDPSVQGTALQKLSVQKLQLNAWVTAQRKRIAEMEAGGASPERIEAEVDRMVKEYDARVAKFDFLIQALP